MLTLSVPTFHFHLISARQRSSAAAQGTGSAQVWAGAQPPCKATPGRALFLMKAPLSLLQVVAALRDIESALRAETEFLFSDPTVPSGTV